MTFSLHTQADNKFNLTSSYNKFYVINFSLHTTNMNNLWAHIKTKIFKRSQKWHAQKLYTHMGISTVIRGKVTCIMKDRRALGNNTHRYEHQHKNTTTSLNNQTITCQLEIIFVAHFNIKWRHWIQTLQSSNFWNTRLE